MAEVHKGCKYGLGIGAGPQGNHGDENGEEAQHMDDEDEALELGQQAAEDGVDEDGEEQDSPHEEQRLIGLRVVGRAHHKDQALYQAGGQVADGGQRPEPAARRQPARDVAQELGAGPRREHGDPVVLPPRRGGHGGQLGERGEDADVAEPHEQEAVDGAGGAAVGYGLEEEDERALPGDEDGAAESQDGHEAEVALPSSWDGSRALATAGHGRVPRVEGKCNKTPSSGDTSARSRRLGTCDGREAGYTHLEHGFLAHARQLIVIVLIGLLSLGELTAANGAQLVAAVLAHAGRK